MIVEIIVAILLSQKLRAMLEEKGRPVWRYVFLGFFLIIFGEYLGAMFGVLLGLELFGALVFGISGLALGAFLAYTIVDKLEPVGKPDNENLF